MSSGAWTRDPIGYADELLEPGSRVNLTLHNGRVFDPSRFLMQENVGARLMDLQTEVVVQETNPYGIVVLLRQGWRPPEEKATGGQWHIRGSLRFYPWPNIAYIEPDTRTSIWA